MNSKETTEWVLPVGGRLLNLPVFRCHTLVVGSGAASLCCAERLHAKGGEDVLILTDNFLGGTSRNTGSDKQTYYKLADAGREPDSPYDMAAALSQGGCMQGDIALAEAQNSLNSFYHLISLGVDFPHNPYGGYTGYKTDHDPLTRGVSLGPYTSKAMTEALAEEVFRRNIPVLDHRDALIVLTNEEHRVLGVLALNKRCLDNPVYGLEVFLAENTVLGVGGPGGLYETSVYPPVHRGGIGMALEAGAAAVNLTESQFGMGSIKFRWNLSGSYQQVLPCYYSTNAEGEDPQYFLNEYFPSMEALCHAIFLKGYQWPFDPRKIRDNGSSLIDLLVYIEREVKGRRVYMDFRRNPQGGGHPFSLERQHHEVVNYLSSSGAMGDTPVERLNQLNEPAIALYRKHGIDLSHDPLEIAVCAQHNTGGLATDCWWESTNLKGLFAVGEVNGSHGVYRPGGSALNAGQVGALRAATKIAKSYAGESRPAEEGKKAILDEAGTWWARIDLLLKDSSAAVHPEGPDIVSYRKEFQSRMTKTAGFVRSLDQVTLSLARAREQFSRSGEQRIRDRSQIPQALRNRQLALTQVYYLAAIKGYLEEGGGSRGSFLVLDPDGLESHPLLGTAWNFRADAPVLRETLQVLEGADPADLRLYREACRPIPGEEYWFERMWKEYREDRIYSG